MYENPWSSYTKDSTNTNERTLKRVLIDKSRKHIGYITDACILEDNDNTYFAVSVYDEASHDVYKELINATWCTDIVRQQWLAETLCDIMATNINTAKLNLQNNVRTCVKGIKHLLEL